MGYGKCCTVPWCVPWMISKLASQRWCIQMYPVSTRTSNKPCESRFMALLLKIPYVTERVCIHVVCSSHSTVSCSAGGHWTSSQHRQAVDLRQWKIDSSRHTKSMKKLLKSMVYGPKKEMIIDDLRSWWSTAIFFIYVFDLLVIKCQILMDNGGRWECSTSYRFLVLGSCRIPTL